MVREGRGIQSIEVGGRILAVLMKASSPMMLRDLALASDLPPAQCHAYLTSYRNVGMVEQDAQSGFYRLGPFAMRLGMGRLRGVPILSEASRALTRIADELGYMALMLVWSPRGPTVIQVQDGSSALNLNVRQGTLFAVTSTASGYIFAAFSDRQSVSALIETELREHGLDPLTGVAPNRAEFEVAIARARQVGYAATVGIPIPGITGVSAPVFDENGALALVITLIGRIHELPVADDSAPVRRLLDVASELTRPREAARRLRVPSPALIARQSEDSSIDVPEAAAVERRTRATRS